MSDQQTRHLQVNRHALNAALSSWLASYARPESGDYWGQYPLFGLLVLVALGSGVLTLRNLMNRHRRRAMLARARQKTSTLGDARFCTLNELHAAGLTDPKSGPLLCMVDGVPIFAPRETHYSLQGPPGSGKSTAIAVMFIVHLAMLGFSVVVSDIKPELALLVGKELDLRGFRTRYNNPAGLAGLPHHDQNPYQVLVDEAKTDQSRARILTTADGFAFEICPEPDSDQKNRYFRDLERGLFVTIVVALAILDPEACLPSVVWSHATNPKLCDALLKEALESEALYGDLAAQAQSYLDLKKSHPEHYEGARIGLAQSLSAFRPSSDLGLLGTVGDFNPADLRDESKPPVVLFDIVPVDALDTYGKAIGLLSYARLHVLKRVSGRRTAFCFDEASNLPNRGAARDVTLLRSRGIVIGFLYQSLSEMKRVFGEKTTATITANSTEQFLRVSDLDTAELISKRIGDQTVHTSSYSFGHRDGNGSTSIGEQARRLMPVDEILAMGPDETLVFVPGLRPIRGRKVSYYHIEPVKHWPHQNAHERHAISPITKLKFVYPRSANECGAPKVFGHTAMLKGATRRERTRCKPARVPLIEMRSFLWVPIVAGAWLALTMIGHPHVLFEYQVTPDRNGNSACVYLGLDGFQKTRVRGACTPLRLLKSDGEAAL